MTSARRSASGLALGSVVSGLLAYAVFALVTHGLGAGAAAPVAVLWTHWAFAGAAFTFPVQHWITRSVASGHEGDVRRAAPRVTLVVVAAAVVLGLLAWLARDPLFHRDDAAFPVMITLVTLGSALVGAVRGGLGGRERFGAVAVSLVAENGLRCLLVAGLLLADVTDPVAHGLCLVAGSLVAFAWPSALRFSDRRDPGVASEPLVFLSGAASSQLVGQVVLTGGPVVLALLGGSPAEVTSMFAVLALFRAPYMVALGAVPQLTVRVARGGPERSPLPSTPVAAGALLVLVALAGLLGGWLGPAVLRVVFGETIDVSGTVAALVAAGCTVAVANLVLTVVGLAKDRPLAAARAWLVSVAAAAVALAVLGGLDEVDRTVLAFVAAEAAALLALALVAGRD
jgi:O-antigen/teichoic acid export membrane protein